ncbi:MAG: papain-like cysteine protease family protein [Erysipelotrichaceae bacterium]|nr:papain-like cysteine protease family protein [Erysipelotrichaceae bacterium]
MKNIRLYKKITRYVILLSFFLVGNFTRILAYPTTHTLAVANLTQYNAFMCWAADSAVILQYHGTSVSQIDFAKSVKGEYDWGFYANFSEVQFGFSNYGKTSTIYNSYLSFTNTRQEIYPNYRPFIAGLHSNRSDYSNHMVAVKGYTILSDNYVRYMDPFYGTTYTKLYSSFVGNSSTNYNWSQTLYNIH